MTGLRVGVVGLGTAGAALACLLAERGVEVEVVERAAEPGPVGAGIWLQRLGQQVLDRLDVLAPLRAASQEVSRVDIRTSAGRTLLDLGYDAVPGAAPALGVLRGTLFSLLDAAVRDRGVPVRAGVAVDDVVPTPAGVEVRGAGGRVGVYDLVVGADGSRSAVRAALARGGRVVRRDRPYAYGALWAVVEDPDALAGSTLYQCLRGTREYLGVLPTGRGRASIFWSEPTASMVAGRAGRAGTVEAWRRRAAPLAGHLEPLLARVEHLLPATYRDVVAPRPYRVGAAGAVVLVGDAAHAMSPQLGAGTSLALADAWALERCLAAHPGPGGLAAALAAYTSARRAHLRWYQWWTRLMMPVFQSDLDPLAPVRDALAPVLTRVPGVPRQLVGTLLGDRTSPWSAWSLPG